MGASNSQIWLQCDEMAFLQALGTHNEASVKVTRLVWLQRYIAVAALRLDGWPKMDKAVLLQEAGRLLRLEQRKASKR